MTRIHFLNVLEGDCGIIQHEDGKVSMIDICCGNIATEVQTNALISESNSSIRGNFNQKEHPTNPIDYLNTIGVAEIFRYVQTHPDMDHMDGLQNLRSHINILNFWDTENNKEQEFDQNGKCGRYLKVDWDCYQSLRKSTNLPKALFYYDGAKNKYYSEDDSGELTDDYIQILAPTKELINAANESDNWNDSSYVLLYHTHSFKILFCGDADENTIRHLLEYHKDEISNLDVLIAPHHGRDSDKDFTFLDIMNPKLTLIGNAKCKYLAYNQWNMRKLKHITNNQAGNILLEFDSNTMRVSVYNKVFADSYCQENWRHDSWQNYGVDGYWIIFDMSK